MPSPIRPLSIPRPCAATLPLLLIGLAGCDGTGPDAFDPVAAEAAAEQIFTALEDNAALDGLTAVGDAFPALGAPGSAAPGVRIDAPNGLDGHLGFLNRVAPFLGAANPAALFPADVLGTTFVYDPTTEHYVMAPERTGAPPTGIRMVLYAVDPIVHRPVTPVADHEIGYLDLTDEGDATGVRLGILVVIDGTTHVDYTASVVSSTSDVTIGAVGFVSDGATQVDVTLTHVWSKVGDGFTLDYGLSVAGGGPELNVGMRATAEGWTVGLDVLHGGNSLAYDLALANPLTGTISHNGEVAVHVGGTVLVPTFTDTDGDALPPLQAQALKRIFFAGMAVVDRFDILLAPAYLLLVAALLGA